MHGTKKPLVLTILDGWGFAPSTEGNAIAAARKPTYDLLLRQYPNSPEAQDALDKLGEYRERLLQKQSEVLALLAQRHQQEYLRMVNLVSKYAPQADQDRPRPDHDTSGSQAT